MQKMQKKFRVGIIGFGQIGKKHAHMLSQLPYVQLCAVADIDERNLEIARINYNVQTFSDYEGPIRSDLECIFLCTPPKIRVRPIKQALREGKYIFCEKPIALSLEEADAIIEYAKHAKKHIMVGYTLRFKQPYRMIKEMYDGGELGELIYCWISKREFFPQKCWENLLAKKHWRTFPQQGGGRFIERSHQMDWLLWIGGRVHSLFGRVATVANGIVVDDLNVAILNFERGFGKLDIAFTPYSTNETYVGLVGKRGSITFDGAKCFMIGKNYKKILETPLSDPFYIYKHFFNTVPRDKRPDSDEFSARDTLSACLALYQSSVTQKIISIN